MNVVEQCRDFTGHQASKMIVELLRVATVTKNNIEIVSSEEWIDYLLEKGVIGQTLPKPKPKVPKKPLRTSGKGGRGVRQEMSSRDFLKRREQKLS